MDLKSNRLALIDSLRGIAALWVMLYHFYNALLPEDGHIPVHKSIDFFSGGV